MKNILIYGAREFGLVVKHLALACGYSFCGFIDDYHADIPEVVGDFDFVKANYNPSEYVIAIAIGYNFLQERSAVYDKVQRFSYSTPALIHPAAYVADSATISDGSFVMAGSTIDINVIINDLAVIWPGAVINHDSEIGKNVFISPNATICGFVKTGEDVFIGASATVIEYNCIPSKTVIKADSIFNLNKRSNNSRHTVSRGPTYSVVIPVYNSSQSLSELVVRLHSVFVNDLNDSFEVIFVDDGSPDPETWSTLKDLATENSFVRTFRLTKNFGQGSAILCGMEKAAGEWIITMDDDLQHCPEDIPNLLRCKKHDVVIGYFPEKQCGFLKRICSQAKGYLDIKLLGLPPNIVSTPFKLIRRRVVRDMLSIKTPRPFIIAMVLAVTSDLVGVEVRHEPRKYGKSNYSMLKSLSLMSNMLFNNSSLMLRLMSLFGFWLAGLSFLFGIYLVARKLLYHDVLQGWTSYMVVLLISTGSIIFCLGILGEYVARLIETTEVRPKFLVREKADSKEEEV